MRITNSKDREYLAAAMPESGSGMLEELPALRAAEAIAIGDEVRDLEAARGERIPFGAVGWGYTHPEALRAHHPEEMFSDLEEILEKVG